MSDKLQNVLVKYFIISLEKIAIRFKLILFCSDYYFFAVVFRNRIFWNGQKL